MHRGVRHHLHQRSNSDPTSSRGVATAVSPQERPDHRHHDHRFFLVGQILAMLVVGIISGLLLWMSEAGRATLWEMIFAGISAVTCTGLFVGPTQGWASRTASIWYLTSLIGSPVIASIAVPLARLRLLQRDTSPQGARLAEACRVLIRVTLCYAVFWYSVGTVVLARLTSWDDALGRTIGAFSNAGFASGPSEHRLLRDDAVLWTLATVVPFGWTLFPVGLRLAIWLDAKVTVAVSSWCRPEQPLGEKGRHTHGSYGAVYESEDNALSVPRYRDRPSSADGCGFSLLSHPNPRPQHPALLTRHEATSVAIGWGAVVLLIVAALVADLNAAYGDPHDKTTHGPILLALAQAGTLRYSGITLVDLSTCRVGQIAVLAVALYCPVWVGIATPSRKKTPGRSPTAATNFLSAIASRGTWLVATAIVVVVLEDARTTSNRITLDGAAKIFFEVLSAYATTGVTLASPEARRGGASLAMELSVPSQAVLMFVMLAGRHRGLPLSLDVSDLPADIATRSLISTAEEWAERKLLLPMRLMRGALHHMHGLWELE